MIHSLSGLERAEGWIRGVRRINAAWLAFFVSLLLTSLAIFSNPTINRDGILYVETAQAFLHGGIRAAFQSFDWPFFSILMALSSQATGIGIETIGFILCSLFMAGTCALTVLITRHAEPEAEWWACLTVLALGGINSYRDELIREFGCWFFVMLGFWLAVRWAERPRWIRAFLAQCCLLLASLFRPEAMVFCMAMFVWQVFAPPREGRARRLLMIAGVPLSLFVLVAVVIGLGEYSLGGRIGGLLEHLSPASKMIAFETKAHALSEALMPYAQDQAGKIVLMGSLGIIPLKFLGQLGLFIVPILIVSWTPGFAWLVARQRLLAWGFLAHVVVLAVFVVDMQFLAGRYIATLGVFTVPFVAIGLLHMLQARPGWKYPIISIAIVLMLHNVVSLHPGTNYFRNAGQWLAANSHDRSRVYVEGSRTAYYAGWGTRRVFQKEHRERLGRSIPLEHYDLLAFEVSRRDADTDQWLKSHKLMAVEKFKNSRGDSVVIAAPEYADSR